MYLSITQEASRLHREEIMHTVAVARVGKACAKGEATHRLVRNLRWELSRYSGIFGKRLRK
jgi:hypothetical protein